MSQTEKHDIESREDIEFLMRKFYEKLLVDQTVGFLFTEIAELDLEAHIPKLVDFWADQLLGSNTYSGNPMRVHMKLHQKSSLKKEHFNVWLNHFRETVDSHFSGQKADLIKERALSIATIMQVKVAQL